MNEAVEIYRELSQFSQPTSATISNTSTDKRLFINSRWSQRDLERKERVVFQKSYMLSVDKESVEIETRSLPQEITNELWSKESPSGQLKAVVRKSKDKKGEEKFFIEVWNQHQKIQNVDLEAADKHGKIYSDDEQFGSLEWSSSEGHLLYIAEKKVPKSISYFDPKAFKSEEDLVQNKVTETPILGKEHLLKEDWGEALVGKCHPVICILDVDTGVISVLENVPDHVSPGQARWGPDDAGILFIGWDHEPFKLGLRYCPIRRSHLYYLELEKGTCNPLVEDRAIRSPVFSEDFSCIFYLDCDVGGPHLQCSRLMMYDWNKKSSEVIIDQVNSPETGADFTGINVFFNYNMGRLLSSDGKRILFNVVCKTKNVIVVINISSKSVKTVQFDTNYGLVELMDIYKDWIVINASAPNIPDRLFIGKLPSNEEDKITWKPLDEDIKSGIDISWSVQQHVPSADRVNTKYKNLTYESILLLPENKEKKAPLIVFPHGGPHSVFVAEFHLYSALLCKLGFAILKVNYRGSFGYGQDSIFSLLGNIGDQDIKDVQAASESICQSGVCDTSNVVVMGGSHGGFITAHLIGQYPDFYKAAVLRNPAINIASMLTVTDITDWNFVEAGVLPYNFQNLADGQSLSAMWEKSPVQYVDNVKTPVMLMVGESDLRVPPSQSREFYRALKARNVPVRFLSYPENNHPISKVDAEADAAMNIYQWFSEHLKL